MDFSPSKQTVLKPKNTPNGDPLSSSLLIQFAGAWLLRSSYEVLTLPLKKKLHEFLDLKFNPYTHLKANMAKYAICIPIGVLSYDDFEYIFKGELVQTGPYRQVLASIAIASIGACISLCIDKGSPVFDKKKDNFYFQGRIGALGGALLSFELLKISLRQVNSQESSASLAFAGALSALIGSLNFSICENIYLNYEKKYGEKRILTAFMETKEFRWIFRGLQYNLLKMFPLLGLAIYTHEARKDQKEVRQGMSNLLGSGFFGTHFTCY